MEEKSSRKYSIIGFPDDLGVRNVQGRLGASQGPASFLEVFKKLKGKKDLHSICSETVLVQMGNDLELNYQNSIFEVSRLSQSPVVVVGGGHDYAYPWIKGWIKGIASSLGCINLDAHFDLRPHQPVMTSGSPFRRLIEEGLILPKNLVEFGIQTHCNGSELWDYAQKNKIKVVPYEKLRAPGAAVKEFKKSLVALRKNCDQILISLDLDVLSFAFAPGVSAPQAEGFSSSEVFEMLEIAGSDKKVTSLGIFELAPPLDVQNYTSRLAAQAAWHFLSKKMI